MSFKVLKTGFEAGHNSFRQVLRRVMARPTTRVVGEPPQIRLGRPHINDVTSMETDGAVVRFRDLLSRVCDERSWSADLRQMAVQFRGVFGWLLGSSTVTFGPTTVNLLTKG